MLSSETAQHTREGRVQREERVEKHPDRAARTQRPVSRVTVSAEVHIK